MPRRNLNIIIAVAILSIACYRSAHGVYRQMLDTFASAMEQVETRYVDSVDRRKLFEGAMQGMVATLDPYSAYVPPRDYAEFREAIDQQFGGIGVEVSWDADTHRLIVLSPMVGSPAYEAGILAGDKIVEIDGQPTEGLSLDQAVRRLRGKPADPVRIAVLRGDADERLDFELDRAIIHVDSVLGDYRLRDGHWHYFLAGSDRIGYVRVTTFGKDTAAEVQSALEWLKARDARGVILDLRNNAGGLLPAATETCDQLIREGTIVTLRGRNRELIGEPVVASNQGEFTEIPLVVLVNRFSASASEIVAACLQDHKRATIVGERTWGKGTVQDVIELEGGRSSLKLTTAKYFRPSEKNIHRDEGASEADDWGVRPDEGFDMRLDDEAFKRLLEERRRRDVTPVARWRADGAAGDARLDLEHDPQLAAAYEYLEAELSGSASASVQDRAIVAP